MQPSHRHLQSNAPYRPLTLHARTHLIHAPHNSIYNLSPERPINNRRVRDLELCSSLDDLPPSRVQNLDDRDDVAQLTRAGAFDGFVEELFEVGGERGGEVRGVEGKGLGELLLL